jgi:hypothetical protein
VVKNKQQFLSIDIFGQKSLKSMKIVKVKDLFSLSLVGATSPFPDWRRPNRKKTPAI